MRIENGSRFEDYKKITKSDFNYLVYTPLIRDLESSIKEHATGRVIDIGCGNKPYETIFEGITTEYVGCDIMQSSLQKVDVLCPANNIPLPDNSFDTAFSTQTIEHVEDHQGLVNEAFRLLKPGCNFIVSGPMYWHLHEEPYDFFRFTKYGFKYVLEKAGFEMVEIKSNGGTWSVTGQTIIHSFRYSKSKNLFIRFSRLLFFKLRIYWLVNAFFFWLDKKDYNPVNTMNYVVIGRKPLNV
jgi:SAM-dependent methyltransferase